MLKAFLLTAAAFHQYIIEPSFSDLIPGTGLYEGTLSEFTLMNNVPYKSPIINIKKVRNIMERRDASCDLIYKKVMGATIRYITTTELYGATKFCQNEFYQGALIDWRNNDPLFAKNILPFFQDAMRTDLVSNAWFGNIDRTRTDAQTWAYNQFDGVFKWYSQYIAAGLVPASQTISLTNTDYRATPSGAYNLIKSMYDKQGVLMRNMPAAEKAFYVDQAIVDGYQEYLRSLGNAVQNTYAQYANGVTVSSYNSIPIFPEPTWEPILTELAGANAHAAILTLRGNFVFATDKNYGEGPDGKSALVVWYDFEHLTWKFQQFLKAGVQIALPEHTVIAVSSGLV